MSEQSRWIHHRERLKYGGHRSNPWHVTGLTRDMSLTGLTRDMSLTGLTRDISLTGLTRDMSLTGLTRDMSLTGLTRDMSLTGLTHDMSLTGLTHHTFWTISGCLRKLTAHVFSIIKGSHSRCSMTSKMEFLQSVISWFLVLTKEKLCEKITVRLHHFAQFLYYYRTFTMKWSDG